jgi:uncharacterized membrane protein
MPMDQPKPILIVMSIVALIAMAGAVYVAVVAQAEAMQEQSAAPAQPPAN